jgi:hypothetical protein
MLVEDGLSFLNVGGIGRVFSLLKVLHLLVNAVFTCITRARLSSHSEIPS